MNTFAEKIIRFNESLDLSLESEHIKVLNPFLDGETRRYSELFYRKYYSDTNSRILMVGINPGRFGAGITGVCFVDPIKLESYCGIQNPFQKRFELSSDFIFMAINAFGGPEEFFSKFLLTAISPLGFVKDDKNINYYDDRKLEIELKPFIVNKMEEQIAMGAERKVCFCIGEGTNFKFFSKLNKEYNFFEKIIPLAHPRYILQYKRKKLDDYIAKYKNELENASKEYWGKKS